MRLQSLSEAPIFERRYGTLQLLCGNTSGLMRTKKADLKIIRIKPESETSHHYHLERESLFHIVSGTLSFSSVTGQFERRVTAGDTIIVEPGEDHVLKNVGNEEAVIFEIESPPHSSSDKIPFGDLHPDKVIPERPLGRFWSATGEVKLKICGIKNLDTAFECHRIGVDAIGIHAVGRRGIENTLRAASWLRHVPSELSVFLLTDAVELGTLNELIFSTGCDTVQLQGAKSSDELRHVSRFVKEKGRMMVRTIAAPQGIGEAELLASITESQNLVDAILIDASAYGGTGKEHDWSMTEAIRRDISVPLIIAGGIGHNNCRDAVRRLCPYGIDVESSVEKYFPLPDGGRISIKDFAAIGKLVETLRADSPSSSNITS
jgi:phosphoribosylanthranilate isomerase